MNMEASPTVSMMTKISDSPMSGRRKIRSTTNPSTKLPARVMRKATAIGTFDQETRTRNKKAPMASSWPWAKLSTDDDLKIMTKPSAESPYSSPMLSPFISSCKKNSIV